MSTVAIINYRMGNTDSVARAVAELGHAPLVTSDWRDLEHAACIILPGVGSFRAAVENLTDLEFLTPIKEQVSNGIPLLGICLGMQLLASRGVEGGESEGLGLVAGSVVHFPEEIRPLRIPHVGWNDVRFIGKSPLFDRLVSGTDFYFVHSYYFNVSEEAHILSTTTYGVEFPSIISNGANVFGTQFHPEKSQRAGLILLSNFLGLSIC